MNINKWNILDICPTTEKMKKCFIRFDEKSNTYDSLEKLEHFLNLTADDPNYWKWSIIALHSSIYGSMILALQGTNPTRVINLGEKRLLDILKKNYKIQQINVNDTRQVGLIWQHGKLISFWEAFDGITKENTTKMNVNSKIFKPETRHRGAIEWINDELRNPFLHFVPKDWSIEVEKLNSIFRDSLDIIKFCLFESGNVLLQESEKKEFEDTLTKIKLRLDTP